MKAFNLAKLCWEINHTFNPISAKIIAKLSSIYEFDYFQTFRKWKIYDNIVKSEFATSLFTKLLKILHKILFFFINISIDNTFGYFAILYCSTIAFFIFADFYLNIFFAFS